MKLNKNQISKIKNFISIGNIHYEDIREELEDHLASAVEEKMNSGLSFELALSEKQSRFNPSKLQRDILINTHWGMIKGIFKRMKSIPVVLISLIIAFLISGLLIQILDLSPDYSEKIIKTVVMVQITLTAVFGLFRTRYLKNSQIMSSGNSLFLLGSLSQFLLRLEWFQWIGFTNEQALFMMCFWFTLLLISGFTQLIVTTKRIQIA